MRIDERLGDAEAFSHCVERGVLITAFVDQADRGTDDLLALKRDDLVFQAADSVPACAMKYVLSPTGQANIDAPKGLAPANHISQA